MCQCFRAECGDEIMHVTIHRGVSTIVQSATRLRLRESQR
jgi:hypothetical protein